MPTDIFYRFGKFIYHYRWLVVILWLVLFASCLPLLPQVMDPFKSIGFIDQTSRSAKANDLLNKDLGYSYNRFIIMYNSNKLLATHPKFMQEVKDSLADMKHLPVEHQIIYPDTNKHQISHDKHTAYAVILFKGSQDVDEHLLDKLKSGVKKPPDLTVQLGGEPIFLDDTKKQTQIDLFHAEYFGTPAALITMLIVFESVIAACLPIILGGISAILILMTLFGLGHIFSLSVFTINIALLVGLCLSLDYALLIINRYRDELEHGRSVADAIATTQMTAGKSVFFSGMAVFISLSALLLFRINILFSVGMGGLAAVFVSVAMALIVLPAILSLLNSRINLLPVRIFSRKNGNTVSVWRWIVTKVVKRPVLYFFITLALLLFMGCPFLHVKAGISDFRILPPTMQSRQVFDTFENKFGESKLAPIMILIQNGHESILNKSSISHLYDYADQLLKDKRVESISSIVNTEPRLSKTEYEMLYSQPEDRLPEGVKKLLKITTHKNLTVMTVTSKYTSNSQPTTDLINKLRAQPRFDRLGIEVTGTSVNTIDVMNSISHTFPYAFLWIMVATYIVMLFFLRSLILPLKAIVTTIISLCASYGILTLVFQDGWLHQWLNFEPQGMLDISLLIIIFCALFGISMDYEVFLLTRIKEFYEHTGDTEESIVSGIDRSCKIISSAAVIVMVICFSFMSAEILIVKAFGLGIAVAVFVDAFIIRIILVPAIMKILNRLNWYLPKWLNRILPQITFDPEHIKHTNKF